MSTGTDIIKEALGEIGAHSILSPAAPESILLGMNKLNSMLEMWLTSGIDIGFTPLQVPGDELNEPNDTRNGIVSNLAIYAAPSFDSGKNNVSQALKDTSKREFSNIKTLYQFVTIPNKVVSSTLPKGAGNRTFRHGEFFHRGERIAN